jgi:hypothetical protein
MMIDTFTSPLSSDRHSMDDHRQQEAEAVASHGAPAAAATSAAVPTLTQEATTKEEDQGVEAAAAPPNPRSLPGMAPNATSKTKKERKKKVATACAICFRNKVKCDGNFPCAR